VVARLEPVALEAQMNDDFDYVDELPASPRKDIPPEDLELLRLAARAIGAEVELVDGENWVNLHFEDGSVVYSWNPLAFNGDALELAVALRLSIDIIEPGCSVWAKKIDVIVTENNADHMIATRRAVTRAAAEIGKAKQ
jgi:hypothetical protein